MHTQTHAARLSFAHTHTHTHTHIHTRARARKHTWAHANAHTHAHTRTHPHTKLAWFKVLMWRSGGTSTGWIAFRFATFQKRKKKTEITKRELWAQKIGTPKLRRNNLRCPETLFISHENAKFLFSIFRVVQGEAKPPKLMGCCRASFAFLHALKIGTFRGKWTLKWVFKTSHFLCLAHYFLNTSKLAFSLIASQRCL